MMLLFLLVSSLAVTWMYELHTTQSKREKEAQLVFVGNQFKRAIASYAATLPPGSTTRALPQSLEDLVDDHRFVQPVHHLRRMYVDPMTGRPDWRPVRNASGILGVASTSTEEALKLDGPARGPRTYAEWVFAINPG